MAKSLLKVRCLRMPWSGTESTPATPPPALGVAAREHSGAIHQTSDHDYAGHGGHPNFWRVRLSFSARKRPAERRFPHHSGERVLAWRQSRDDGFVGGHAARKAVLDDCRDRLDDLDELARPDQHYDSVQSQPQPRWCSPRRAIGHHAGFWTTS